ncbi:MAG: serine O-acetyltransferase EpsC [Bacteroidota bacterium]
MSPKETKAVFDEIIQKLNSGDELNILRHATTHDAPMPSVRELELMMERLQEVLFPGYFGHTDVHPGAMDYHIGASLDEASRILTEQIRRGLCFPCDENKNEKCSKCSGDASVIAMKFLQRIPEIRKKLSTDVVAAFTGDPAAKSYGEAIFCYPSVTALTHHRIAHELLLMGVPLIPRIISEMAHARTGIEIHPGAEIGEYFFIDHGTGVVIGETTIIGKNVRLYQGVTLGAKSFPLDENGKPIKGIPRHPIVEDDVIIYSNATVLGRITIGKGSVIGGNIWVTEDVPAESKVLQK